MTEKLNRVQAIALKNLLEQYKPAELGHSLIDSPEIRKIDRFRTEIPEKVINGLLSQSELNVQDLLDVKMGRPDVANNFTLSLDAAFIWEAKIKRFKEIGIIIRDKKIIFPVLGEK